MSQTAKDRIQELDDALQEIPNLSDRMLILAAWRVKNSRDFALVATCLRSLVEPVVLAALPREELTVLQKGLLRDILLDCYTLARSELQGY